MQYKEYAPNFDTGSILFGQDYLTFENENKFLDLENTEFHQDILTDHVKIALTSVRCDMIADNLLFICKYFERFPTESIQLLYDLEFYAFLFEKLNEEKTNLLYDILKTYSTIIQYFTIDQLTDIFTDVFIQRILQIIENSLSDYKILNECFSILCKLASKLPVYSEIMLQSNIIIEIIKIENETSKIKEIIDSENIQINDELRFNKCHSRFNELKELEKNEDIEAVENQLRKMIDFCINYSISHQMHIQHDENAIETKLEEPKDEDEPSFRQSLFNQETEENDLDGYRMSYDDPIQPKTVFHFPSFQPFNQETELADLNQENPNEIQIATERIHDIDQENEKQNDLLSSYNFAIQTTLMFAADAGFCQYKEYRAEMTRLKKEYDLIISHNIEKEQLTKLFEIESQIALRTNLFGLLSELLNVQPEILFQYLEMDTIMALLQTNFYFGQKEQILGFILKIWYYVCVNSSDDFMELFNDEDFRDTFWKISKIDNGFIIQMSLSLISLILEHDSDFFPFEFLSEVIQKSLIFTKSTKVPFAIAGLDILQKFYINDSNLEKLLSANCLISNICRMCQNGTYDNCYNAFKTMFMIMELCDNKSFMKLISDYPIIDSCLHFLNEEDHSIILVALQIFNRILCLSNFDEYYKFINEALFQKWDLDTMTSLTDDENEEVSQLASSLLSHYEQKQGI